MVWLREKYKVSINSQCDFTFEAELGFEAWAIGWLGQQVNNTVSDNYMHHLVLK